MSILSSSCVQNYKLIPSKENESISQRQKLAQNISSSYRQTCRPH